MCWNVRDIDAAIVETAAEYGVPEPLLRAVVEVEGGGDPWAIRYEDHFRWLCDPEEHIGYHQSLDTEKTAQKTSWGLMQVMGALARELGFEGSFLSLLCKPELSLKYGALYLRNQHRRYGCWGDAVAAYNAGSVRKKDDGSYRNQRYVDRVDEALGGEWPGE